MRQRTVNLKNETLGNKVLAIRPTNPEWKDFVRAARNYKAPCEELIAVDINQFGIQLSFKCYMDSDGDGDCPQCFKLPRSN